MPISDPQSPIVTESAKSKIVYIDHLKVLLTGLVVLHHAFVTYGAPGGWYYSEKTLNSGALIAMTLFVANNQAFFMGFFFFLSALFLPSSYAKKGAAVFIKDRLFRLGIPLLFYSFLLSPVMNYLVYYYAGGHHITFMQFVGGYDNWISFGVMWFVVALLLFTLLYVLFQYLKTPETIIWKIPTVNRILLFATALGITSFLVRLIFPVGWILDPVGFQLGHFSQYIVLFIFGLVAANSNWLGQLNYHQYRKIIRIALGLIIFGLPLIYAVKVKFDTPVEWFSGGLHVPAFLYAMWEQITGLSVITALLIIGKQFWNKPSVFLNKLSRCAFAVYIFHPLVLISLSLILRNWNVDPSIKALIVAPLGVFFSFLLGHIIVQIPGVKIII